MLFPLGAIMRMLPRSHRPNEEWATKLTKIFGDEGWEVVYSEKKQLSLFPEADPYEREPGIDALLKYATERYKQVLA